MVNKRIQAAVAGILLVCVAFSQEGLKPLSSNINYFYEELKPVGSGSANQQMQQKAAAASLQLPFKEDFNYAPLSPYPEQSKWMDSSVYINTGFGKAPMSIGVATFDGLNKHGYPYDASIASTSYSKRADTLTSRPINLMVSGTQTLQPTDKVAMTFYYQAGGYGDYPENNDSLVLDFYAPLQQKWKPAQWFKIGPTGTPNYNDSMFKRAFVWIKDTQFLQDNFRFRFRNTATTNGDFDHWNLDYIYINKNRDSIADTSYNHVAFTTVPASFLKDYTAMPYKQYDSSELAARTSVRLRSNNSINVNLTYKYQQEFDRNSTTVYNKPPDSYSIGPFPTSGYLSLLNIASPTINKPFINVDRNSDFRIKHFVYRTDSSTQFFSDRSYDTVMQSQKFTNYYAFDDGSAEAGYYVLGAGGKVAVKVKLNKPDTLIAVRIYFEHVANLGNKQTFTLSLWSAGAGGPGNLLYSDTARAIYRQDGFKEFPEYKLKTPQVLAAGTYYIGFKQGLATGISVGYDVNYDHRSSLYFDSGSGWTQSGFYGSLMMRPVFGNFNGEVIGIDENAAGKIADVLVYPNPSNDWLNIVSKQSNNRTLSLLNALGQLVKSEPLSGPLHTISTAQLSNGVYFLLISEGGRPVHSRKIIISH